MKKYIVIVILVGMVALACNRIVLAESKAVSLELKYRHKLILAGGRYIKRYNSGSMNLYRSKGHVIKHFPSDSKLKRNKDGTVFIISKEKIIPLGIYKDIIQD
jgi:hypothetical protein